MSKSSFYAGYDFGLHHRSINAADCAAHMAHDEVKFGARNRFVVLVTGSYFPNRANDHRGTLDRFLLENEFAGAAGFAVPAWIVDRKAAAVAAAAAAKAAKAAAAAQVTCEPGIACDGDYPHCHAVGGCQAAAAVETVTLDLGPVAVPDVDDVDGIATLAAAGAVDDVAADGSAADVDVDRECVDDCESVECVGACETDDDDDESPRDRKNRLARERRQRRRLAMGDVAGAFRD